MKKVKGIIFDLDGTLLYTLQDLNNAINYALKKHNKPEITIQQTRMYIGNGIKMLVIRALNSKNEKEIEETLKDFVDYYSKHAIDYTVPYEGILDLLETLKNQGYKMAIVSNKFQEGVDGICRPIFSKYINSFVGGRDGISLKPSPDMVNIALKELNLTNEDCMFVGDSDVDVKTGKNANMKVVAVSWGYKDKDYLQALNPNYLIDKPIELVDIIEKENDDD